MVDYEMKHAIIFPASLLEGCLNCVRDRRVTSE